MKFNRIGFQKFDADQAFRSLRVQQAYDRLVHGIEPRPELNISLYGFDLALDVGRPESEVVMTERVGGVSEKTIFGMPVRLDESMPVDTFRFEHPDGRMDSFMLVDGHALPVHLTKLGDPPNRACPVCSFVNERSDKACACCGLTDK